jgi:hypothetical protein
VQKMDIKLPKKDPSNPFLDPAIVAMARAL